MNHIVRCVVGADIGMVLVGIYFRNVTVIVGFISLAVILYSLYPEAFRRKHE